MSRVAWMRIGGGLLAAAVLTTGALALVRDGSDGPPDDGEAASRDERRAPDPTTATSASEPEPAPTLLVWTSGGLTPELPEQVAGLPGVEDVAVVRGDLVDLVATSDADGVPVDAAPPGMRIPLDALAIDPVTYPPFVSGTDAEVLAALGPGEAVLGETSARLRRLDRGGVLELAGGATVTVVGVVADESVGAAELVVAASAAPGLGVETPRFLLVAYTGGRAELEDAIAAQLPDAPVRFRGGDETPFLRHADLVLPQALVKERFGEFAYRPSPDSFITIDPTFEAAQVVTAPVPILGSVTCHRDVIPALDGALRELEQSGLASLIDPAGYQGCYVGRTIPGTGGVSRHSWGIAIDVNFLPNPGGPASFADPRLEEVMERWGFIAGSRFLVTDPGHFEYVREPE